MAGVDFVEVLKSAVFREGDTARTPEELESSLSHFVFSKESQFQPDSSDGPTFIEYAIDQILFALHFIRQQLEEQKCAVEVRLRPVQVILERLFARYWNNRRDFEKTSGQAPNKFHKLIDGLWDEYAKSWISKRIINQFLLGLNQHACDQIAKLCFLVGPEPRSASIELLHSIDTFLGRPTWAKSIRSISKLRLREPRFWTNWAKYVMNSSKSTEIWNDFVQEYSRICSMNTASPNALIPATYCLIALTKECKNAASPPKIENLMIFSEVLSLIEHTDVDVRCCGAIAAIVLRQLLELTTMGSKPESEVPAFGFGSLANQQLFKEFHSFLSSTSFGSVPTATEEIICTGTNVERNADQPPIYKGMDASFVGKLRSWDLSTYNDVLEIFIEPSKSLSDQEVLLVRHKALLRIPVLISANYQMDSKLAARLARIVLEADFHDLNVILPLNLALYKLTSVQPEPVCAVVGEMCFDAIYFSLGQRYKYLESYSILIQLLSGRKCLQCMFKPQDESGIKDADQDFWKYFVKERAKFRRCFQCRRLITTEIASSNSAITSTDQATSKIVGKTRRFASPRAKLEDLVIDPFSNQYSRHLWTPIYGGLISFPETNKMKMSAVVINYLGNAVQLLREIIQGTSSSSSFVIGVAPQVTDLAMLYIEHEFAEVKLIVLRFLAFYLHHTDGKTIQALKSTVDVFQQLQKHSSREANEEVRDCIQKIELYVAGTENAGLLRLVSGILG